MCAINDPFGQIHSSDHYYFDSFSRLNFVLLCEILGRTTSANTDNHYRL